MSPCGDPSQLQLDRAPSSSFPPSSPPARTAARARAQHSPFTAKLRAALCLGRPRTHQHCANAHPTPTPYPSTHTLELAEISFHSDTYITPQGSVERARALSHVLALAHAAESISFQSSNSEMTAPPPEITLNGMYDNPSFSVEVPVSNFEGT